MASIPHPTFKTFAIEKYSYARQSVSFSEPAVVPWQHHPSRDDLYLVLDQHAGHNIMKVIWKSEVLEQLDITALVHKTNNGNIPSLNVIVRSPCIAIKYVDLNGKNNCRLQVKFPNETLYNEARGYFERAGCIMRNAGVRPAVSAGQIQYSMPTSQHARQPPVLSNPYNPHPPPPRPPLVEQMSGQHSPYLPIQLEPSAHVAIHPRQSDCDNSFANAQYNAHGNSQHAPNSQHLYGTTMLPPSQAESHYFSNICTQSTSLDTRPTSRATESRGSTSSGTLEGFEISVCPQLHVQPSHLRNPQLDIGPPRRELPDFDAYSRSLGKKPLPRASRLDPIPETSPHKSKKRQRDEGVVPATATVNANNAPEKPRAESTLPQVNNAQIQVETVSGPKPQAAPAIEDNNRMIYQKNLVSTNNLDKAEGSVLAALRSEFALSDPVLMNTVSCETLDNMIIEFLLDDANIALVEKIEGVYQNMGLGVSRNLFRERQS